MDIIRAINSPKIFRPLFDDLRTWENWFVCLKAIFGLEMDQKEQRIYRKFTGRTDRPSKQFSEVYLAIGRRGGKSFTTALICVWLACFKEWNLGLEKGYIMCIATDKKQAGVVLDYVRRILQLPIFKGMVKNETKEEIELSNRMVIAVHTCSYRSLRGFQICACACDEINFWRSENSSSPAKEVLIALSPSLGNAEGSLMIAISSTYSRTGPLFEAVRDKHGKNDPQTLVWRAGTTDMNPTYSTSVIRRALKDDFQAARAEFFAEFRADLETFLPVEVIDSAVVNGRYELPPLNDVEYFAFCDPSGGRGDSMTLSICHKEDSGRLIQDCLATKKPPFDPAVCVKEFVAILNRYGISMIEGDRYGGEWVSSAFQKESIFYQPSPVSKSDIFLESLPLFMTGRVELLDNPQQSNELKGLERRTRSGGRDQVDHMPGAHDDAANALCGSLVVASRTEALRAPPPSLGIAEKPEAESLEEHMVGLLLDQPQRKKRPGEISDKEIIDELAQIDQEIERERRKSEGVTKRWK